MADADRYLASVLSFLAARAEESVVEGEPGAEPRPPEHVLAHAVGHDGQLDLLEHLLVAAAHERVLAPASHEAVAAGKVLEAVRQADGVDVGAAGERRNRLARVIFIFPSFRMPLTFWRNPRIRSVG